MYDQAAVQRATFFRTFRAFLRGSGGMLPLMTSLSNLMVLIAGWAGYRQCSGHVCRSGAGRRKRHVAWKA